MVTKPAVLIIKKKKSHAGHHGGAWKVAYADFVTAMMALFIVLWLMNSNKQIQEAVGGYFRNPSGTGGKVGTAMAGSGENFELSKDNMSELKRALEESIREVPNFDKLKDNIDMAITGEGLRIELTESSTGTFFDSGSPKLSADSADVLIKLAEELGKLPNEICIEGHTDSKPFANGTEYGNWELSTERAHAARRLMEKCGLRASQVIQVRGFADHRLRKPDAPLDPSNRRISLIVRYQTKPDGNIKGEGSKASQAEVSPQAKEPATRH
jgi:chemotaxis protein MotB